MTSLRWLAPLVFGLAGLVFSGPTAAQPTRVPTVTRLVKVFAEREAKVNDAIAARDRSALEALLADDFEMRIGSAPGTPIARAEWLDAITQQRDVSRRAGEFAVHDEGTVAIVSFRLTPEQSQTAGTALLIVDVWRKAGEDWKLGIRYAASAATAVIPGASTAKSAIPKKY